jgi:arylsulfatase A-like enzyme/Tfp pilus assembly protein PilF
VADPPDKRPRSRWLERIWLVLAVVLITGGVAMIALNWALRPRPQEVITHEILAELDPVDRIEAQPGDLRGFNVLLITSDTTRADHVGCYGNRGVATPVIDGLARHGTLCATTVTPSPATLPAHASLLTGRYPHRHGARANGTFRLEDRITTLAERLREVGYRTAAMISAFVLDSRFGLHQGFDVYDDDLTKGIKHSPHMFRERPAELTNQRVTGWLRETGHEPFFLWVHYFDPHAVYLPPEPFRTQYRHTPYDGEIAYVDSQVGALMEQLEELGIRDKTLVIFTSDHGEGLGEHGEQTHSLLIYDSTLHVPLIFNAPSRLPRGKVIHRQTCLVDVVPTVLALLGEEVPDDLDGVSLCQPPPAEPRPVLIETIATMTLHGWAPLVGVRREDYKYILAPTSELYDLQRDPGELNNLYAAEPQIVRAMSDRLGAWLGEDPFLATRQAVDLGNLDADDEIVRHLAALGYVGTVRGRPDDSAPMHDPKDMVPHWEKLQHAMHLRIQGRLNEALPIIEGCVAEVDGDIFARSVLAGTYFQRGEYDKALDVYRRAVELEPNDETLRLGIAAVHLARGELEASEEAIEQALAIEPQSGPASVARGRIATRRHDEEQALRHFEKAIELDPGGTGPTAHNEIGVMHLRARRLEEARAAFRNALEIDALNGGAHTGLANVLIEEDKLDEAMRELRVALRFDPNQPGALASLGSLLRDKGAFHNAIALCQRALELSPKFPQAHNNIGLIYRHQGQLDLAQEHYFKAIEYGPYLDAPHVNLAQLYIRQDKVDEGMEEFRRALRVNPYCTIALANLGARHFNEDRIDQAFAFYRRALVIDPDYALVHKNIASIHVLRNDPEQAAHHLRRSLELDPGQPESEQMRDELAFLEATAPVADPDGSSKRPRRWRIPTASEPRQRRRRRPRQTPAIARSARPPGPGIKCVKLASAWPGMPPLMYWTSTVPSNPVPLVVAS